MRRTTATATPPRLARARNAGAALATALTALVLVVQTPGPAAADTSDEQKLARKYAPLVRLVPQEQDCGAGEPFRPVPVDPLFDNPDVALRGPWTDDNLVAVGPTEEDVARPLQEYSLDFPGNPLSPGCDYEEWFNRVWNDEPTTVYAHVATEEGLPGRLALQYWFYYPFNDFNNKHESDWETIQLEFDVATAAEALETDPATVLYSQHEAGEQSAWDDPKLSVVDDTHPEVFASAGSHSNHYETGLFLLRSSSQGLGCDSTLDAAPASLPQVVTIPSDPAEAARDFPWTVYRGQWGQQFSQSFYSGPTGPTGKASWTEPFTATERRNDISYQVPAGEVYGVKTTDAFCSVVERGSVIYLRFANNPVPVLTVLVIVLAIVVWLVRRTSWGSTRAFPLSGRRTFGQILSDSWEAYRSRIGLYVGIGGLGAAAALCLSLLQQSLAGQQLGSSTPPPTTGWTTALGIVGPLLQFLIALLAASACTQTLVDRAAGRRVTAVSALRSALPRFPAALWTVTLTTTLAMVLLFTLVLAPLALAVGVAAALIIPVVTLEGVSGVRALRRSGQLVARHKTKMVSLVIFGSLLGSVAGGFVGVLLLALFQVPFVLVNAIPGVIGALLAPLFALALTYAYEDARLLDDEDSPAGPGEQDAEQAALSRRPKGRHSH